MIAPISNQHGARSACSNAEGKVKLGVCAHSVIEAEIAARYKNHSGVGEEGADKRRIRNVQYTRGVKSDTERPVKQRGGAGAASASSGGAARAAAREGGHLSVGADQADFVVILVHSKYVTGGVDRQVCGPIKKRRSARAVCGAGKSKVGPAARKGDDVAGWGYGADAVI